MMQTPLDSSPNLSDTTLFISDLHLCASRPAITSAFLQFLENTASKVHALYILGDLFEYWAGDDDIDADFHQQIITAFRRTAAAGVSIYLMHGNRDFLIGETFCQHAGIILIPDPTMINLYGQKALLSHGDDLCTDDIAYQQFRSQVRDKKWQADFLDQPLSLRKLQIEAIRARSEQEKTQKSMEIMDVNTDAVNALLQKYQPDLLIHGHTHRPDCHTVNLVDRQIKRWVLGDWYEQGSYLACDRNGCKAVSL